MADAPVLRRFSIWPSSRRFALAAFGIVLAACGGPGNADAALEALAASGDATTATDAQSAPPAAVAIAASTPYSGAASNVPATLQAANFDLGGEGVAYHDKVPGNAGGAYRTGEDVDIISDGAGGYIVNNFESGEWLTYSISVATAGQYAIELRASSAFTTGAYHAEIDGNNVTGRITVPNTSGWAAFQWVGRKIVSLTAGTHALKIAADQQYFNLSAVRVTAVPSSTPYSGTPSAVPGTLQAVNFDLGGEGVAYHDNVAGNSGGQYRPAESVDIISDAVSGAFVVNNVETGEWLAYTVKVAATAQYNIELSVSSAQTSGAFHVEIDGTSVTGRVAVPATGGWNTYQWLGKSGVSLAAGTHVLKVVADQQYFNLSAIRVTTAPSSSPYAGAAFAMPGTQAAVKFDWGGEGAAYHDRTPGNAGGQFRTGEDVDIIIDPVSGGYIVNGFDTGEWLSYLINVAATAAYTIELRASSTQANSAFHVEVDGNDVTGRITVPNTGGWSTFQWAGKSGVQVSSGAHALRVVSDRQYFNLDSIRLTPTVAVPLPDPGSLIFSCTFPLLPTDCGFGEQAKAIGRATITTTARDGLTAVRLRTQPGDSDVFGSGTAERDDLSMSQAATDCYEGKEQWWAHSVLFPDDYVVPPTGSTWNWGVILDFHHTGSTGQANFHVLSLPTGLVFRGFGGATVANGPGDPGYYEAPIGPVVKNVWYDFVYHVKWSSGADGYFDAWVNGVKKLSHRGPTLYTGMGCYLKLANYHTPVGQAVSVIHDRVLRGTTAAAVSLTPLQ
ncbi:MAG TPA: carbohydrate-binding protein [Steroidobacteraceae bacterium]|nr:carbohydrate-binding protein [Steroidobacteraceae bacterium]